MSEGRRRKEAGMFTPLPPSGPGHSFFYLLQLQWCWGIVSSVDVTAIVSFWLWVMVSSFAPSGLCEMVAPWLSL